MGAGDPRPRGDDRLTQAAAPPGLGGVRRGAVADVVGKGEDGTTATDDPPLFAGAGWFDPIEDGLRQRIRGPIGELTGRAGADRSPGAAAAPRPRRRSRRAAAPPCASGGWSAARSPTAWGRPANGCSPSPACPQAGGSRRGPPTPSGGRTRGSSAASRREPSCPRPRPRPCCPGPCSPPARSPCARSTAGRASVGRPPRARLTSPPEPMPSSRRRSLPPFPTLPATAPSCRC